MKRVSSPSELSSARVVVFPGVGAFGSTVSFLDEKGFRAPLLSYLHSGRPFLGICLGMQTLFESSEESPGAAGLGLIPGVVALFPSSPSYSVPSMGWNGVSLHQSGIPALRNLDESGKLYFVHSYRATVTPANARWVACTTDYGGSRYISAVAQGGIFATQFHPEKSGPVGLAMFRAFLESAQAATTGSPPAPLALPPSDPASAARILDTSAVPPTALCRRIIACLDVRSNDEGDLVVTKGDQYDVREVAAPGAGAEGRGKGGVRNLGKPVDLCARYYEEGADEITFLNITAFRAEPLDDTPMLGVLEASSERVFVPLTVRVGLCSLPARATPW